MYRLIILLFFVLSFFKPGFGQTLLIGISGGPNLSDLRYKNSFSENYYKLKLGYSLGANITFRAKRLIGIRTGIDTERKGGKHKVNFTDDNGNPIFSAYLKLHFDYVSFPVLAEARFGQKWVGLIQFGAKPGYLLATTSKLSKPVNVAGAGPTDSFPVYIDDYNRWDYALSGGLGGECKLNEILFLQTLVRYEHGMTNLFKQNGSSSNELKNSTFSFEIGLQYHIGGKNSF